jgi:hypothetical protein
MTNPQDAQSLLMGGGGRGWSWAVAQPDGTYQDKPPSTSVTGIVDATGIREEDQTDIKTKLPLTWSDGKTKKQIVIPLQTQFRDDGDDDGRRMVRVKQSSNLQAAIRDAVKAAGASSLEDGGTLTLTFTGTRPNPQPGFNPIKVFSAQYVRPTQQGALMDGMYGAPGTTAPPAPTQTNTAPMGSLEGFTPSTAAVPASTPTPVATGANTASGIPPETVAVVKGLLGMRKSVEEVAAVTGLTVEQINQLPPF